MCPLPPCTAQIPEAGAVQAAASAAAAAAAAASSKPPLEPLGTGPQDCTNEERDAGEAWALYRLKGEAESLYWPHDNGSL